MPYEQERRGVGSEVAIYDGDQIIEFINRDITVIAEVEDDGKVENVQRGHLDYKNLTNKVFTMVSQY